MKRRIFLPFLCFLSLMATAQTMTTTVTTKELIVEQEGDVVDRYDVTNLDSASFSVNAAADNARYMTLHRKSGVNPHVYLDKVTAITYEEKTEEVEETMEAPKVGDYYYSDGTWSDGGLISINADGTNPVWAAEKPAPKLGRTVIGIVAMTDPSRMAEADKADGYTHGYVISSRFVHDPNNTAPGGAQAFTTTKFTYDDSFEAEINLTGLASSAYLDIDGRSHCNSVMATYADQTQAICPSVYYVNIKPHPATSSEWFVPSAGQLWDIMANLCGNKAAQKLRDMRTQDLSIWWGYANDNVSDDPMAIFNATLEKVADSDKELLVREDYDDIMTNPKYTPSDTKAACPIWTSSRASTDAMVLGVVGTKKSSGQSEIGLDANWFDGDAYLRPILAF